MDGTVFAFDPDWVSTLSAPFMTNAFIAGLCIALAAGMMGYFTIARHSTFAAHALAHIGLPRCHRSRIARSACLRRSWRVRPRRSAGDRRAWQESIAA